MNKLMQVLNDDKTLMIIICLLLTVVSLLTTITLHSIINTNNCNVDKIVQIADKAGIQCQVKTNNVLHVTVKKIVK